MRYSSLPRRHSFSLARVVELRAAASSPVSSLAGSTEPLGDSDYADAMRELIAEIDERRRTRQERRLRLVRS